MKNWLNQTSLQLYLHKNNVYDLFWNAQYPFWIIYLPTQIQMAIVYRKTQVLKIFDVQIWLNNHQTSFEKTTLIYLKAKNFPHTTRFKYVFIVFEKTVTYRIFIYVTFKSTYYDINSKKTRQIDLSIILLIHIYPVSYGLLLI